MEYLFNELKQFDLKPTSASNLEHGNYYIKYDENYNIIAYFYYDDGCIVTKSTYKINYPNFNKFYKFGNKTFNTLTIITETFLISVIL